MPHPKHPACPNCGKSLYKAMGPAKVRVTDPYQFCRNKECKLYGPKGVFANKKDKSVQRASVTNDLDSLSPGARAALLAGLESVRTKPLVDRVICEPVEVQKARSRIRQIIGDLSKGASKVEVGLVLAICTQETGNHAAANLLIDEFELDKKFGLQKFEDDK